VPGILGSLGDSDPRKCCRFTVPRALIGARRRLAWHGGGGRKHPTRARRRKSEPNITNPRATRRFPTARERTRISTDQSEQKRRPTRSGSWI